MPLPVSFREFPVPLPSKFRRLFIGTEGPANSGKSEFALSAPGPGIFLALDRQYDQMLENPEPPVTRNQEEFLVVPVRVPLVSQMDQKGYLNYWNEFYSLYRKALDNPDARTVVIDGDSDSWELQQLAEYGKLTQIPPILRTSVNAARKAMYARAWDANKIVICTNKLRKKYEDRYNAQGQVMLDDKGKPEREWKGEYERVGYWDYEYLFQIQLRHLYRPARTVNGRDVPQSWGIQILMCKAQRSLEGAELWGDDCNFRSLVELVYPHITPREWGFKD